MKRLPSRLRRLDGALADLPLDEPMLLTEMDGFLTGILLGPEPILPDEWMQSIWGADDNGVPPFDDPLDVQWFADAVIAHRDTIQRDLTRGKPQPIFDIDERNGDAFWESWIDGFVGAMELRPEGWAGLVNSEDADEAEAASRLAMLIAIARDESPLDSMHINAFQQRAPGEITDVVRQLYAARLRRTVAAPVAPLREGKVGRNDPCPCGSGRKFKRCCADA